MSEIAMGYDEDGTIMGEPIHDVLPESMMPVAIRWRMRPRSSVLGASDAPRARARNEDRRGHEAVDYAAAELGISPDVARDLYGVGVPRPASTEHIRRADLGGIHRGGSCGDLLGRSNCVAHDAGPDFSDLRMYFVGRQDRTTSEEILKNTPVGTFLIRDGSRGLALSITVPGRGQQIFGLRGYFHKEDAERTRVIHMQVKYSQIGSEYYIVPGSKFSSVGDLVEYYLEHPRDVFGVLDDPELMQVSGHSLIPLRIAQLLRHLRTPWVHNVNSPDAAQPKQINHHVNRFLITIMLVANRVHAKQHSDNTHVASDSHSASASSTLCKPLPQLPIEMWLSILDHFRFFNSFLKFDDDIFGNIYTAQKKRFLSRPFPLWWQSMGWILNERMVHKK
eukprot:m.398165 g.398165  ORF g.398165 m.398165 type:complete len:392 (-) comp21135_c0_seq2:58-1233(-)